MEDNKIYTIKPKTNIVTTISIIFTGLLLWLSTSTLLCRVLKLQKYEILICLVLLIVYFALWIPTPTETITSWSITDNYLEYSCLKTHAEKIKFIRKLLGKYSSYSSYKIEISKIESIRIFYRSYTSLILNSKLEHPIYFGITLKDGSYIAFKSLLTPDHKYFVEAVRYLQDKQNIKIYDKYNLLKVLEDSSIDIVSYIDELETESKND